MMWYKFQDTHAGGGRALVAGTVYIEASSREDADYLFHLAHPYQDPRGRCPCCGPHFSVEAADSLSDLIEEGTALLLTDYAPLGVFMISGKAVLRLKAGPPEQQKHPEKASITPAALAYDEGFRHGRIDSRLSLAPLAVALTSPRPGYGQGYKDGYEGYYNPLMR